MEINTKVFLKRKEFVMSKELSNLIIFIDECSEDDFVNGDSNIWGVRR